jgi:hypothetical protein
MRAEAFDAGAAMVWFTLGGNLRAYVRPAHLTPTMAYTRLDRRLTAGSALPELRREVRVAAYTVARCHQHGRWRIQL